MVFGTESNQYTAPGITSGTSRSFQSGPLEVLTTDSSGNLATDGGRVMSAIARAQAGIALGFALSAPQLTQNENFGVNVGYGYNDGDGTGVGLQDLAVASVAADLAETKGLATYLNF